MGVLVTDAERAREIVEEISKVVDWTDEDAEPATVEFISAALAAARMEGRREGIAAGAKVVDRWRLPDRRDQMDHVADLIRAIDPSAVGGNRD